MKISLIGAGNIGSQFYRHATRMGWSVPVIVEADGVYDGSDIAFSGILREFLEKNGKKICERKDYLEIVKQTDIAVIAIPTFDNGETAYKFIKDINAVGIPVVTSEKGALSYKFSDLEGIIDSRMLGFNASVGGGTRMLHFLNSMAAEKDVTEIHAIVNATINNIISRCEKESLDDAIKNSIEIGIAEPGSTSASEIINTEAVKDIPRKAVIIFNMLMKNLGSKNYISFTDIKTEPITDKMFQNIIKEAENTRYIVSIVKNEKEPEENPLGGFKLLKNDWLLTGGFRKLSENRIFEKIWVYDEFNSMVISKGNNGSKGLYSITGQGARPEPTVDAMIFDVLQLSKSAKNRL